MKFRSLKINLGRLIFQAVVYPKESTSLAKHPLADVSHQSQVKWNLCKYQYWNFMGRLVFCWPIGRSWIFPLLLLFVLFFVCLFFSININHGAYLSISSVQAQYSSGCNKWLETQQVVVVSGKRQRENQQDGSPHESYNARYAHVTAYVLG